MNKILFEIISSIWLFIFRIKRNFTKPNLQETKSKPLLVSEACKIVDQVLDNILTKESEPMKYICNYGEDDKVIYELFDTAFSHLENRLGSAIYNGIGGSYNNCLVKRPRQMESHDFSNAIKMAWWVINDDIFYIVLTGHDADTLRCFTARYVY